MSRDAGASYSTIEPLLIDGEATTALNSSEPDNCSIGEVAGKFGVTPRTLRFYESVGLLKPRRHGTARFYSRSERQRLALVLKAKSLGFTLVEIRQMLAGPQQANDAVALSISRHQCFEQIKLLEQRKREIERALGELRRTYSAFYARIVAANLAD